ncbi:hypothetical protein SAMN05216413_0329 [Ruminococcaceae bacterium KH2T8]|nr:hypothetical protein SAMN05216413_0329 [Ruminococcaceae bacterium KH2T8]
MKTRKFIEIIGSAALIGALAVTGCSVVRAAELDEADESAVEIEETESDETDIEESEDQDAFGEEEIYGCCWVDYEFVSTNGELDGQLDYMTLYPNFENIDWDLYPADESIHDMNQIDDEEIRAIAQEYADNGFTIYDPELREKYATGAIGDSEYMFNDGFTAYSETADSYAYVAVYRMNETLFDYFLGDYVCIEDPETTDDGTVIRIGNDNDYVEFNRDTGIGVRYLVCDYSEEI